MKGLLAQPARAEPRGWAGHIRRPHPGVRQMIAGDYLGFEGGDAMTHPLLLPATATVPVIITLVDPTHRPPAFLHGAHADYAVQHGPCAPAYLQLTLAPLGAYQLLGLPVADLGPSLLDLDHVFGAAAARRMLEQVRDSSTWAQRFDVVDSFFLASAQRGPRPAPEVSRAYELLTRGHGNPVGVAEAAAEVGWSHQHLITRFTQQVGLTPKRVARIARFERIVAATQGGTSDWGRVAAENGYADQSHLIRDFRAFAGTTPSRFPAAAL